MKPPTRIYRLRPATARFCTAHPEPSEKCLRTLPHTSPTGSHVLFVSIFAPCVNGLRTIIAEQDLGQRAEKMQADRRKACTAWNRLSAGVTAQLSRPEASYGIGFDRKGTEFEVFE